MLLCTASVRAQDFSSERALLMVHFGTTYDATRQKTIDAINRKARRWPCERLIPRASS